MSLKGSKMPGWIALQEYSQKYNVSISILKQWIKNCEVEHVFREGRYLLPDTPPSSYGEENSLRELKFLYQKLLREKELELGALEEQVEDLKNLVSFLEREKKDMDRILKEAVPALFLP